MQPVRKSSNSSLQNYADLLVKWNSAYNLIAPSTVNDIWNRHVEDSLQLLALLPQESSVIMDVGTGAGLPAIPLAIKMPQHEYHLVEPIQKKCLFLANAKRALDLENIIIHQTRVEYVVIKPDIITARAVAPLTKLLGMIAAIFENNTPCRALLLKGEHYHDELQQAQKEWQFDCQQHPTKQGAILEITNIGSM